MAAAVLCQYRFILCTALYSSFVTKVDFLTQLGLVIIIMLSVLNDS